MGPTHTTKQRIMERNRYNPQSAVKQLRKIRQVTEHGSTQTFKKPGDLILSPNTNPAVKDAFTKRTVTDEGFQS